MAAAVNVERFRREIQLGGLVMQLLEKRPADRPQSARDVMRALDTVISQPTGVPSQGGTGPSRFAEPGRNVRRRASALGLGLVVIAAGVASLMKLRPAGHPPPSTRT